MSEANFGSKTEAGNTSSEIEYQIGPADNLVDVIRRAREMAMREQKNVRFMHNNRTCTLPFEVSHMDLQPVLKRIDKMKEGEILTADEVRQIVLDADKAAEE